MIPSVPLINGVEHSFVDILVNILGVPVAGIVALEYRDAQVIEDNMGAGGFPVSRGYGQITATGQITLLAKEVAALEAVAPQGRLQFIPEFDIVIKYLPVDGSIVTHILKNVKFKENNRTARTGDTKIEVTIPLQISHIVWKP